VESQTERDQQIATIVATALRLSPGERESCLRLACEGDPELHQEVAEAVEWEERMGTFLLHPVITFMEDDGLLGAGDEIVQRIDIIRALGSGSPPLIGRTISRYHVLERIGGGGMGVVYKAEDIELGRFVALKFLLDDVAQDAQALERFRREARATSALNHPMILAVHDIGTLDGTPYIVSEFLEGETLRERLRRGSLPIRKAIGYAQQIARGLSATHAKGIVHRDLKPENVFLTRNGRVKILDFGLAKMTERQTASADPEVHVSGNFSTNPGMVMGSLHYMSPEQVRGLQTDERTDIWSLGCVLYEMIAGSQPFRGATAADVLASIINANPEPLRHSIADAPAKLKEIVGRALAKDKDERYQGVKDLLGDIQKLKRQVEFETEEHTAQRSGSHRSMAAEGGPSGGTRLADETDVVQVLPLSNLPARRTSVVGREREIEDIHGQLRVDGARLLTLTGVGGTGKTALAQAVARRSRRDFSDGIYFIELASIGRPELVASVIAQSLGVKEAEGKTIGETLIDHLRGKSILLVIDNFEQVSPAASILAEILASAPRMKMLVTSREVLHLTMECEYMVPPLATPENLKEPSLDELSRYDAIRLFVERAREVKANFTLTEANARSVAAICAGLDGLPLAIELAAARVKLLSPEAILTRLKHRLKLLTGGARDLPARQRTMSGTVEWSYNLLSKAEKQLFRRLAVFAGGFTMEAAEAACQSASAATEGVAVGGAQSAGEEQIADVLDGVTSLMDKSLLVAKETWNGAVRFRMLEVVREYALERLQASAELDSMQRSHAAYLLSLAEEAEPHLHGAQPAEWLNRLEQEYDNIRGALWWSIMHDATTAARLGAAIRYFWHFSGDSTEGLQITRAILRLREPVPEKPRWKLLIMAGNMARFQGDYQTAREMYEKGLEEGEAANDPRQVSASYRGLGGLASEQGDHPTARMFIDRALAIARDSNDKFGIARALSMFGDLARSVGDDASARPFFEEALAICRVLDNRYAIGTMLNNLAAAEYGDGDHTAARLHFAEGLTIAQTLDGQIVGDKLSISVSLDGFAALAAQRGETKLAATLAGAAALLLESMHVTCEAAERRFRDRYLVPLRATLSEGSFAAAYEHGRNLKLAECIALALGKTGS
jgi:non-specific serine/threonine protein kinase